MPSDSGMEPALEGTVLRMWQSPGAHVSPLEPCARWLGLGVAFCSLPPYRALLY